MIQQQGIKRPKRGRAGGIFGGGSKAR